MRLNRSKDAAPLYIQIKKIIKTQIEEGVYQYNDLIKTELEYKDLFNVSRITVRQAIHQLEFEGYVEKIQGMGTRVVYTERLLANSQYLKSFKDEMGDIGVRTNVTDLKITEVEAEAHVAFRLGIEVGTLVYQIERIKWADDKKIGYFVSYFTKDIMKTRPNEDEIKDSVFEYVENVLYFTISELNEAHEATLANEYIASKLDIRNGDPIMYCDATTYDDHNRTIEFTKRYMVGRLYKYSLVKKQRN